MFSLLSGRSARPAETTDYVDAAVGDELAALTGALTAFYLIVSVAHWFLLPRHAALVMTPLAAVSACILLATFISIQKYRLWAQWLQPLAFFVFSVALINCAVHLYLLGKPEDSTNLALLVAASGWLTLSYAWYATAASMIWASWLGVVLFAAPPGNWPHFGFFLLGATALGFIIQSARRNMFLRMIRAEADRRLLVEHLEEVIDKRTHDLRDSQDKLRHSERLASIGTLAAGIAHEINNPLGLMVLSAHRIKSHLGEAATTNEIAVLFNEHSEYGQRCARIVKNVLHFAREQPTERGAADLNAAVTKAVVLTTAYATERGGTIETSLDLTLPAVTMNRLEIEQVLVNLINNGIESAANSPHVVISSGLAGGAARLEISDNGRGMSDQTRAHMFDPFFTTRRSDGGTGLGLSLVYGIVYDHGGTLEVISKQDQGTKVIVELPLSPTSTAEEVEPS
ncbi:MAG TPA: ATP-binding protein [Pirellulales bacterium]|jgi:signal transduction histidine kinase